MQEARSAFDQMLAENSFVEFWGRLGKMGGKGIDSSIGTDDLEDDAGDKVDMKALAKNVNVEVMCHKS
jgi:transcription elongation regulator 1